MTFSLSATLECWSACAPMMADQSAWHAWSGKITDIADEGIPDISFLPALFRRRLSRLNKFVMAAMPPCLDNAVNLPTVFASRHGELDRTVKLLDSLVHNNPLSPTAFSLSVHNTASGLYSIMSNNTQPATAIAAGADSLEMGYIEACSLLRSGSTDKVVLVVYDEPLPDILAEFQDVQEKTYALVLLLSNLGSGQKLTLSWQDDTVAQPAEIHAISLLRLLCGRTGQGSVLHSGDRINWRWELSHAAD